MTRAAVEKAPTAQGEHSRPVRAGIRVLITSPALIWILALIVAPNLFLFIFSLYSNEIGTVIREFTFDNYIRAFTSRVFQTLFVRTFLVAAFSAVLATLIAYPGAYLVVRKLGRWKLAAALLVLVPLWVSYLMRVFAWRIILGERGVLNGLLTSLGILDEASDSFLYSIETVAVTLTYIIVPYVFLASYSSLERIPESLYEASADCGGHAFQTFVHVIWPLTRPGVMIGFAIGFVIAFGDYVTAQMVGGLEGTMLGTIILQQFGIANNWPYGSAIGVTIMLASFLFLAMVFLFSRTEAQFE